MKATRRSFCQICRKKDESHEPVWAMQYIASDKPSFYKLGSQIRGFGVLRICDECRQKQIDKSKEVDRAEAKIEALEDEAFRTNFFS